MTQRRRGNRRVGIRRDNNVKLSLSDEEHALLARAAQHEQMTTSGFAAHAALGVARKTHETAPDIQQSLSALNEGVIALNRIGHVLQTHTSTTDHATAPDDLIERLTAAIDTLEEAGDAVLRNSRL